MPNASAQELWAIAVKYCPLCGGTDTYWRHGQEFDHMRRCSRCQKSWEPDRVLELLILAEEERLKFDTTRE